MLANLLELVFALSAYALELRSMEIELRSMEHHRGLELCSTSTERLELISGRQRRGPPRHSLGTDALQHAEGGEPLEQKGALHLGEHFGSSAPCSQGRTRVNAQRSTGTLRAASAVRRQAAGQRTGQARGQGQTEMRSCFWACTKSAKLLRVPAEKSEPYTTECKFPVKGTAAHA
eukprot:scaffold49176_cov81-Phaeocystis_antarctica.AAC.2